MHEINPTVSVIIPTYNRAPLIGRAIQSVLDQTYQDFELIVVDDGSKDDTEDIVTKINDARIIYVRHERNKGAHAARNTGIAMARGEYIAFQDSDDVWLPEKLERQIQAFKIATENVGVVYTGFWRIEGDKKTYIPSPKLQRLEGDIHNELLRDNFVGTPVAVIKRECFAKAGVFDEGLPCLEDWELFIRISKYYPFKCINEPLLISYFTSESVNSCLEASISARLYILEKHYDELKKDKRDLAHHYFSIGNLLCLYGDFSRGKALLRKTVRNDPLRFKYLGAFFASLLGKGIYRSAPALYQRIHN